MNESVEPPSLLDLLAGPRGAPVTGGAPSDRALANRADRLMNFSLAEYERIVDLDEDLGRLVLRYTDRQGASAMRRLYEHWADQADDLLEHVRAVGLRECLAPAYEKLDEAVGRTRAMLNIPLSSLERADEQIRRGETFPIAEVRRELRTRSHA